MKLCVVGLGLIGSSIGAAAKKRSLAERVTGVEPNEVHAGLALSRGCVDEVVGAPAAHTDLVVVSVPPPAVVAECHLALEKGDVVTDVCGVKASVVGAVHSSRFVGAHPLAGGVTSGPAGSDPDLFEGRAVVLTPGPKTDPAAVETVESFWKGLGARPLRLTPDEHDRTVARVSQLPHAIAWALARAAGHPAFQGRSFEDATRVAAADPIPWASLFLANRASFREAVVAFRDRLDEIADAVEESDRAGVLEVLARRA